MAGEVAGAGELTVWLTLRLLKQLLPSLLHGLEQQTAGLSRSEALRGELLQGFAQRKAVAEMTPATPVRVGNNAANWVAEAVVISRSANGVTLTFRAGDGREALLPLNGGALRQWLAIVYRAFCDAEWHGDFWPAWLVESAQPTAPPGLTVH